MEQEGKMPLPAHPEQALQKLRPFTQLMMYYRCALFEVETKLNVLNEEFSALHHHNPIETIKARLKKPLSIVNKLQRRGLEPTLENIENELNDIAGIRVICAFVEDIYLVVDLLEKQDDIRVLEVKDYIRTPKPNGYRSLHLIISIPIFLSTGKKHMRVEVQFRTIAMDFWASLEHQLKYKKEVENAQQIVEELRECAQQIALLDEHMQGIRTKIRLSRANEEELEEA